MPDPKMPEHFDLLKELLQENRAERRPDPGRANLFSMPYVSKLVEKLNKRATKVKSGVYDMSDDEERSVYEDIINSERYTILANNGAWVPFEYREGKENVKKDSSYKVYLQYREVDLVQLIKVMREYLNEEATTVTLDLLKSILVTSYEWALNDQNVKDFMTDVEKRRDLLAAAIAKTEVAAEKKHEARMAAAVNKPLSEDLPRLQKLYVALRKQLALKLGVPVEQLDTIAIPEEYKDFTTAIAKLTAALEAKGQSLTDALAEDALSGPPRETPPEQAFVREDLGATTGDVIQGPKGVDDLVFNKAVALSPSQLVEEALAPVTVPDDPASDMGEALVEGAIGGSVKSPDTNKTELVPEIP